MRSIQAERAPETEIHSALQGSPIENADLETEERLQLLTDSRSAAADRFRYLRLRLTELRELTKLRTIVITSPIPGDGKSTVAISLATALADKGKQAILLIEADLHRPSVAKSLGLRPRRGLAECLEEGSAALPQIRRIEPLGWYLLQAGAARGNPTELMQSEAASTLIRDISPFFDWILIDTPPALALTDALSLSRYADATLLVARAGKTSREEIEACFKLIGSKRVVGIVLNGADRLSNLYSRYQKYYDTKK